MRAILATHRPTSRSKGTTMKINVGESITAGAIIAFGAAVAYFGSSYPVGTLGQMGPGYFPVALGVITALIGLATLLEVLKSDATPPEVPWRSAMLVFAGIVAWALTAERFGLVIASFAVVTLTAIARPPVNIVVTLVTAVIASAASVLVFIYGFGLPLRAFNW